MSKHNILILDDDPFNLDLISKMLEGTDFYVSTAKTGRQAVKIAGRVQFSLAILDINLPDTSGFDVSRMISELQPECEIIFCSADDDRRTREKAFSLGGIDYIEKPFVLSAARQRIINQIEKITLRTTLTEEKSRLEKMISSMTEAVVTTDLHDTILSFNDAAERLFKISRNNILGKKFSRFVPPELRGKHSTALLNYRNGKSVGMIGKQQSTILNAIDSEGASINVDLTLSSWTEKNETFVTAIIRDRSKQDKIEDDLSKISKALNDTQIKMARYSHHKREVVWTTVAFEDEIASVDFTRKITELLTQHTDSDAGKNTVGSFNTELNMINNLGVSVSYLFSFHPTQNNDEVLIFANDITDFKKSEIRAENLLTRVRTDELTGCMSRRGFLETFEISERTKNFVLAILDIDYFKSVNDAYGHAVGDKFLKEFSRFIQIHVPNGGTLARLGGEEFVLLFEQSEASDEVLILNNIRDLASEFSYDTGARAISRTVSIGATHLNTADSLSTRLAEADEALQFAKDEGRNRIVHARKSTLKYQFSRNSRFTFEDVKTACLDGRITFYLQEIYDIKNAKISGYEALIRLKNIDQKIVSPHFFLDEYYHLTNTGKFSHSRAYLFAQYVQGIELASNYWISYNIRGSDLTEENLHELIEYCNPNKLGRAIHLELSEKEIADRFNLNEIQSALLKLKECGFGLSLDDFGREQSNFHRLVELPFDIIKLDKSLIDEITVNQRSKTIARMLKSLSLELGADLIAEGIETADHANQLLELGIHLQQGYLHGKPHPMN